MELSTPDRPSPLKPTQSYSVPPPAADDEPDVCRVCRSGAEEDGELFWPCQCSGSMRFVHESCLKEWIKARGNETNPKCELCHTPLLFDHVFADDMPTNFPPNVLAVHAARSTGKGVLWILRAMLVAAAWLAMLPYAVLWVFRFLLFTADSIGVVTLLVTRGMPASDKTSVVSRRLALALERVNAAARSKPLHELKEGLLANVTIISANWTSAEKQSLSDRVAEVLWTAEHALTCGDVASLNQTPNPMGNLTTLAAITKAGLNQTPKSVWARAIDSISQDVFQGQILTSAVVLVFVICFLLREWIAMNAPVPGDADPARNDDAAAAAQREAQEIVNVIALLMERARNQDNVAGTAPASLTQPVEGQPETAIDGQSAAAEDEWLDMSDEEVEAALLPESGRYRAQARQQRTRHTAALDIVRVPSENEPGIAEATRDDQSHTRDADTEAHPPPPLELPRAPPPLAVEPAADGMRVEAENEMEVVEFDNEPMGEDLFDDLDGILDAVGMKGSLMTLFQNLGLMILLISLCLAGGVWLPLCVGRLLAASNAPKLVVLPLRMVRAVSDPLLDAVFETVTYGPKWIAARFVKSPQECDSLPSIISKVCHALVVHSPAAKAAVPTSKVTGKVSKRAFLLAHRHWKQMAIEDDPFHRALCVVLGYAFAMFGGFWYLKSTQNDYSQQMNKAIRDGIKQQFILLKVGLFVAIEVIFFPALCGFLLGLVTLPLFPGATIALRASYLRRAPFPTFFYTWMAGTTFMFAFSSWIDLLRAKSRKGLIWFVRDPQSAEFHPIRDILERSTRAQARKLATSALLYGGVILLSFGINVHFLKFVVSDLLPLRWPERSSAALPIDLIFYRFVVPATISFADPRSRAINLGVMWSRRIAHSLRLTSFMFGVRDPTEEFSHISSAWRLPVPLSGLTGLSDSARATSADQLYIRDGGFARVPALDTVRVAPGRKMFVRVTEDGNPLDEEGSKIMAAQIVEMASTRKSDKYEVVYVPPYFRTRLILFLFTCWAFGSLAISSSIAGPILLGRLVCNAVIGHAVHDVYTFAVGAYIFGTVIFVSRNPAHVLKTLTSSAFAVSIPPLMVAFVLGGFVVPTLASFVGLAYLYVPSTLLRLSASGMLAGDIELPVGHSWTIGLALLSTCFHATRFLSRYNHFRTEAEVLAAALNRRELVSAAQVANSYLLPLTGRLVLLLVTPYFGAIGSDVILTRSPFVGVPSAHRLKVAYTFASALVLSALVHDRARQWGNTWVRRKLEEVYLIERRLLNFEKPTVIVVDGPAKTD